MFTPKMSVVPQSRSVEIELGTVDIHPITLLQLRALLNKYMPFVTDQIGNAANNQEFKRILMGLLESNRKISTTTEEEKNQLIQQTMTTGLELILTNLDKLSMVGGKLMELQVDMVAIALTEKNKQNDPAAVAISLNIINESMNPDDFAIVAGIVMGDTVSASFTAINMFIENVKKTWASYMIRAAR